MINEYLQNRLVKIGLVLLVLGSGPLLGIIICAKLGLLSDPNSNPIGAGLLAGVTFWPAVICLTIGVSRVRKNQQ
jgi:hypothetical protein